MKTLRKKPIIRFISFFLILVFTHSLFAPTVSFALTAGPHQPEYMGYEEPGATDMVNLLTGDFSFRIPAIDIPGPEGGFSVPLSYKSGVGLNQEASWVGLGWSLNAGAITRNIVEYPDDASGESFQIHRQNDNIARGWQASIPGVGNIGWNSNDGHRGRISLLGLTGLSYGNGSITAGNFMGMDMNKNGVSADPVAMANAAITVATFGMNTAASGAMAATKSVALSVAIEAANTLANGVGSPSLGSNGYWKLSKRTDQRLFHTNYWIYLDQTRYEDMYGVLNLGNMNRAIYNVTTPKTFTSANDPVTPGYINTGENLNEKGSASDMHYYFDGTNYYLSSNPTSLAKDNYSIMGPGISGAIEPYRMDMGTLSMPRQMSENYLRLAMLPWRQRSFPESYKVQFRYRGSQANAYYHHVGGTPVTSEEYSFDLDDLKFGIDHELANPNPSINRALGYRTSDPTLPRRYQFSGSGAKLEEDRTGLTTLGLAQRKDIEWYMNSEIINGDATGFIDYFGPGERDMAMELDVDFEIPFLPGANNNNIYVGTDNVKYFQVDDVITLEGEYSASSPPYTRTFKIIGAKVTAVGPDNIDIGRAVNSKTTRGVISVNTMRVTDNTIGGFQVTREDGRTYHYALPVYEWSNLTYVQNVADPDNVTTMSRAEPFASTWLLTAITGSDYVDRNNNGQVDDGDWGYWVELDYGRFSSKYDWRIPFDGFIKTDDGEWHTYNSGKRQQYYLNSIKTRTHTALFIKGWRFDGHGTGDKAASSLRLDEIILLKNKDLSYLESLGLSETVNSSTSISPHDSWAEVYDVSDISNVTPDIRPAIDQRAIRRVKFNYDYSLCLGALNSYEINLLGEPINIENVGKLKLQSISIYGRNSAKVIPDYTFDYEENPGYDINKWDGWGYYQSTATSDHTSHRASNLDKDGTAWSLTSITTPLGHVISPKFERDRYSSISGYTIPEKKGGDIRTTSLSISDGLKEYKTQYVYEQGVVAQEPSYIKTTDYNFYNLFDFPLTPVLYGKVSVLSGKNSSATDYHTKEEYEFETPHHSMISTSSQQLFNGLVIQAGAFGSIQELLKKVKHRVDIKTASIGNVKSIKTYNNAHALTHSSIFTYTDDVNPAEYSHQGVYTEGSFLIEKIQEGNAFFHKVQRTTKRYYPNFLRRVESTNIDGHQSVRLNRSWDFLTGRVLQQEDQSPLGITTLTETIPAHKVYPEMGSKKLSLSYKSITGANVATYSYKTDALGGNKTGLIAASVETWNKDWVNYRMPGTNGEYADTDNTFPTWRRAQNFVYQGVQADLKADGTLTFTDDTDRYDFGDGTANNGWLYTGELLRFDNFSMPVEAKDRNNIYSSIKTDANHEKKALEASNARYTEVAWSGAENGYIENNNIIYLDGEVRIGSTQQLSSAFAHTGETSLLLTTPNEKGFHYVMKAGEYDPGRSYRLGVWARSVPDNLSLYYKLGTTETLLTPTMIQAGEWSRLEALIPASALNGTSTLEVGCRTVSGDDVYVDDFRFQPMDAGMTAYVYTGQGELWYVLDNENMFSEYQYNDKGELVRTYVESFAYGRVQTSETTRHYKGE